MTPARASLIERGLTGVASRVLDFVPLDDCWTPSQIHSEIMRQKGTSPGVPVVEGCLASLLESGLVKMPKPRMYVRVHVRQPNISGVRSAGTLVKPTT